MSEEIIQPFSEKIKIFLITHPLLGWAIVAVISLYLLIKYLFNIIPQLEALKSDIIKPLAKKFKHKKLIKAAIKSDIRGNVNSTVMTLQNELPKGWCNEMDIKWVEEEKKEDFLNDNEAVIRMRPLDDQDMNFVLATYYYFKKSIFPKIKSVIPDNHLESSALYLSQRLLKTKKEKLIPVFQDNILESVVVKNKDILKYINRYEYIDSRGLFTGTFLREIQEVAKQIRFSSLREIIDKEIEDILTHLEKFIKGLKKKGDMPDSNWRKLGPVTKYGLLLIAQPQKVRVGIKQYVNRAKKDLSSGIKRLYIFGTRNEKSFAVKVIHAIDESIPEYKLIEIFHLFKDYRKRKGGIGALFIVENKKN